MSTYFRTIHDLPITVRIAYYGGNTYSSSVVLRADAVKFNLIEEKVVGLAGASGIPLKFYLLQNYPNPFNNRTTIEYSLGTPSGVELLIYNIRERLVERFDFDYQSAGKYFINWDSRQYSSGLYVYVLKTDNGMYKRKMLLIK